MKSEIMSKSSIISKAVFLLLSFTMLPKVTEQTAACLYCRRSDWAATLLVSYSYCASSNTCLQDRWLYIDRNCQSDWKNGKDLDMLNDCKPKRTSCHPFVSKEQAQGSWFNFTETLGSNEYC